MKTLPVLMICARHGKKKQESESGGAQGQLSVSFHFSSLGCMVASQVRLFHHHPSLKFEKCQMV